MGLCARSMVLCAWSVQIYDFIDTEEGHCCCVCVRVYRFPAHDFFLKIDWIPKSKPLFSYSKKKRFLSPAAPGSIFLARKRQLKFLFSYTKVFLYARLACIRKQREQLQLEPSTPKQPRSKTPVYMVKNRCIKSQDTGVFDLIPVFLTTLYIGFEVSFMFF